MMVVTIDTTQFHVLAIDLKDFPNDLHFLHTQMIVEMLDNIAFVILQLYTERIEVGLLRGP